MVVVLVVTLLALVTVLDVPGFKFILTHPFQARVSKMAIYSWEIFAILQTTLYVDWRFGLTASVDIRLWRVSLNFGTGYWEDGKGVEDESSIEEKG